MKRKAKEITLKEENKNTEDNSPREQSKLVKLVKIPTP